MKNKILRLLKLAIVTFLTAISLVFKKKGLKKVVALLKGLIGQCYRICFNFCVANPIAFSKILKEDKRIGEFSLVQLSRLENLTRGLYELQNPSAKNEIKYSIIVPVYKPVLNHFRILAESCLNQSVNNFEVIFGLDGPQPDEVNSYLAALKQSFKNKIKVIQLDRKDGGGISRTTNHIVNQSVGSFLLFVDHDDWIRPDLLFRYDLILSRQSASPKVALYCDEFKIDENNNLIANSYLRKADRVHFPYLFVNWVCHCLLISREDFLAIGGCRPDCDGAQDYDLVLRLDTIGVRFFRCPVGLYAWRTHAQSTAGSLDAKDYASPAGLRALKDYVKVKELNWEIIEGEVKTTYLALPFLTPNQEIQVVIPFKDQLEMTRNCLDALAKQLTVKPNVTLVDNNSSDKEAVKKLVTDYSELLDIDLLNATEPFNFSRLCNDGAKNSKFSNTDSILFLNNDVILSPEALSEMSRWINQPQIGAVGCRLLYPDGSLQHGGIDCRDDQTSFEVCWSHTNYQSAPDAKGFHSVQRVTDALTAAALLVNRSVFNQVAGFDETFYPIAFSDTTLCAKINSAGYHCFYNPLAKGIHWESKSRAKYAIEDFDSSDTLFHLLGLEKPRKSFYYRADR